MSRDDDGKWSRGFRVARQRGQAELGQLGRGCATLRTRSRLRGREVLHVSAEAVGGGGSRSPRGREGSADWGGGLWSGRGVIRRETMVRQG